MNTDPSVPQPSRLCAHFLLDHEIVFLNHGSFGACPRAVLDEQARLRARLEREPVSFYLRDLEALLDEAREALAAFVGAAAEDVVFIANATTGVNAVLRSLRFDRGDELVVTDHAYNACANALAAVAEQAGARVVVARVPFPLASPDEVVSPILEACGPRTRLALVDHVTSPTGIVFPIARIVAELAARGIDTLVDGAHAPGMLPLDLRSIGAAYYTGNCHKWLCAPKGAAFLHVRADRQSLVRPTVISHGANSPRTDRSRYRVEFDWTGTTDPTASLCVPTALRTIASLVEGGWPQVMDHNHRLAVEAQAILARALGVPLPAPASMLGSLAAVPLPAARRPSNATPLEPLQHLQISPLQDALFHEYRVEVPIVPWPAPPRRLVRVSAQLYNSVEQYEYLARLLPALAQ